MIGKIILGKGMGGLLRYLTRPEAGPEFIGGAEYADAALLRQLAGAPEGSRYVYHVMISLPTSDGRRSQEEWMQIVRGVRTELGLPPWVVAIRHTSATQDHIHLVSTAWSEGRRIDTYNNYRCLYSCCRELEQRLGLTRLQRGQCTRTKTRQTVLRAFAEGTAEKVTAELQQGGLRLELVQQADGRVHGGSVVKREGEIQGRFWLSALDKRLPQRVRELVGGWRGEQVRPVRGRGWSAVMGGPARLEAERALARQLRGASVTELWKLALRGSRLGWLLQREQVLQDLTRNVKTPSDVVRVATHLGRGLADAEAAKLVERLGQAFLIVAVAKSNPVAAARSLLREIQKYARDASEDGWEREARQRGMAR